MNAGQREYTLELTSSYGAPGKSFRLFLQRKHSHGSLTMSHLFLATTDGVARLIYTINGQTPGPLLQATQGETFVVTVVNKLPLSVGMHWCVFLPS